MLPSAMWSSFYKEQSDKKGNIRCLFKKVLSEQPQTDYGTIRVGAKMPGTDGVTDVVLGLDSAGEYEFSKGHLVLIILRMGIPLCYAACAL